jgi:antitoxin ParD1/3/4
MGQMSKNTSISIGDHFANFIDEQLQAGRFGSASEVVRAGLRLLEEHEAKVKRLQDAPIAGEESGPPAPFDNEKFLQQMRTRNV